MKKIPNAYGYVDAPKMKYEVKIPYTSHLFGTIFFPNKLLLRPIWLKTETISLLWKKVVSSAEEYIKKVTNCGICRINSLIEIPK